MTLADDSFSEEIAVAFLAAAGMVVTVGRVER